MIGLVKNQSTDPRAENRFQMNLLRLAGKTEIISIEVIFEVIEFVTFNGITELHFIEEEYLPHFFNDDTFMSKIKLYICSFPSLVKSFESAREENNPEMLYAFRVAHRAARQFLADPEIKDRIKTICHQRTTLNQYRSYNTCIQLLLNYSIEFYHHTSARKLISQFVPMFVQNIPSLENVPVVISDGNIIEPANT